MNECNGCRFCCWVYAASVPTSDFTILIDKPGLNHCSHECEKGCALHASEHLPPICRDFHCPYQLMPGLHRPDTFQSLLEELHGTNGGYIPIISDKIPVSDALALIARHRSVMAAFLLGDHWIPLALPIDKNYDNSWTVTEESRRAWKELYEINGVEFLG